MVSLTKFHCVVSRRVAIYIYTHTYIVYNVVLGHQAISEAKIGARVYFPSATVGCQTWWRCARIWCLEDLRSLATLSAVSAFFTLPTL